MSTTNAVEFADRKARLRPLGSAIAALYFLGIQPWVHPPFTAGATPARGLGWALNAACLLLLLLPIVGLAWGRRVRELINDDVARQHLRTASSLGFFLAMGIALALFALPASAGWTARQAIYLVVTPAVALPLLLFAWLDWRSNADA